MTMTDGAYAVSELGSDLVEGRFAIALLQMSEINELDFLTTG